MSVGALFLRQNELPTQMWLSGLEDKELERPTSRTLLPISDEEERFAAALRMLQRESNPDLSEMNLAEVMTKRRGSNTTKRVWVPSIVGKGCNGDWGTLT